MKKGLFYIVTLIACVISFTGCIKNGTSLTINPSMTANLGTYTFNAATIQPSLLQPQLNDSVTSLIITGYDPTIGQKIVLRVRKFKGLTGTFSIIQGEAGGTFYHNGITSYATSGIVAINNVGNNIISGYYSFSTNDGISLTNGTFVVGNPWNY